MRFIRGDRNRVVLSNFMLRPLHSGRNSIGAFVRILNCREPGISQEKI